MLAENLAEEEGIEAGSRIMPTLWMMFAAVSARARTRCAPAAHAETQALIDTFRSFRANPMRRALARFTPTRASFRP